MFLNNVLIDVQNDEPPEQACALITARNVNRLIKLSYSIGSILICFTKTWERINPDSLSWELCNIDLHILMETVPL